MPDEPVHLDCKLWASTLRSARRGAAGGPARNASEHLKVVLDDEYATDLLADAVQRLAEGNVPAAVADALRVGRLTALLMDHGHVRGIVVGDTFGRGVARALARQFGDKIKANVFSISVRIVD